jgi:hypothetical protein
LEPIAASGSYASSHVDDVEMVTGLHDAHGAALYDLRAIWA